MDLSPGGLPLTGFVLPRKEKQLERGGQASVRMGTSPCPRLCRLHCVFSVVGSLPASRPLHESIGFLDPFQLSQARAHRSLLSPSPGSAMSFLLLNSGGTSVAKPREPALSWEPRGIAIAL